ncbi:hypothetical protein BFP76_03130 [Amylibacter kogurei]|uniref:DUF4177 domain-containing protein n=1 Tax=Paramylibacter kogurei TaxID=1889778 RepID=A0A2G5K5C0_9RHOB|nr:DUF4177 domain-containing protein [Amylibacter kogurei]PIB24232.1 hypothetical protein BFP76_03130 [Amylibacter kogurei]
MGSFIYKVIPAPAHGKRAKGAKGIAGRFANGLETAINELAAEGWEYIRAESLPSVERVGITRRKVETFQNVLVFRKASDAEVLETPSETPSTLDKRGSFFRPKPKPEPNQRIEPKATAVEETVEDVVEDAVETVSETVENIAKD